MSTLLDLMQQDQRFRRVSTTNGGEWAGPCVFCGTGKDRMRIWPQKERFWCRQCRKSGDAITYLREFRGLSFRDAAQHVGKVLDKKPGRPQPDSSLDVLGRYLEEQYAALHQEWVLCEWAARSIEKSPETYSDEERREWALTYLRMTQWHEHLERLWTQIEEKSGTGRDRARAA